MVVHLRKSKHDECKHSSLLPKELAVSEEECDLGGTLMD